MNNFEDLEHNEIVKGRYGHVILGLIHVAKRPSRFPKNTLSRTRNNHPLLHNKKHGLRSTCKSTMEAYLTYKARANYSYTLVAVKVELPALAR